MADREPLDLFCEVTTPGGTSYKWDANQPPDSRLRALSFSTKIGEGFSLATGTLARRIDQDYPDLVLGASIVITGADGQTVFEGRLSAMPRELGQSHSISVTFVGWMAHAKGQKFSEVYVDRGLSEWKPMSVGRRSTLLLSSFSPNDPETSTDVANTTAAVSTPFAGVWASPYKPISEAWYDAGPGVTIGKIGYSWQHIGVDPANANWNWQVFASDDDKGTTVVGSGNLRAASPSALQTYTPTVAYRYALLQHYYNATPAGTDGARYQLDWYKLAVYGSHGLTLHTGETNEPQGVYGSDVIRDIAGRFCPLLNTAGVEDDSYVIQHLKFDRQFPHDAFLEINKFHLRHLAVWENKTLTWRPYDLSDYDWEIRTDDPGTTFAPVGPTLEDTYNAVEVTYTDLRTGTKNVITRDDYDELEDTSDENPWNQAGTYYPLDLELSAPVLEADAVQIGRAALADKNRPKTAGTLTQQGYIRDRAGIYQPVSKVRAGDVICVTNFNEINRLIVETDYDDESKTVRVAVDLPFQLLEAYFDRLANARTAKGL